MALPHTTGLQANGNSRAPTASAVTADHLKSEPDHKRDE
jgi:hypothetical protein